jgi:hypothetical protein
MHTRPAATPALFTAVAAALLAGCATPPPAAPTAPAKTTQSVPVLASGYKKVPAPAGASVYFINLKNGDVVTSPVLVQFGLRGMGVAPAGVERENTGHHHLLINVDTIDVNVPMAFSDSNRHFGGGQSEATVALKPGTYTLQLVLADANHIPHHPPVLSDRITVTVK